MTPTASINLPHDKNIWLRRFAKLVVLATLALIFIGSLVTSTGSALAVPDWPLAYGMLFPPMIGGVLYEHGHRLAAATVGFLTLSMAVWLAYHEQRGWVRKLGYAALLAVIAQGLLGGLTVLLRLPTAISVSHAIVAQSFFCITIVIAYGLSRERAEREAMRQEKNTAFSRTTLCLAALVFTQLILGAIMRHTASGLAVYDFPRTAGQWIPSLDDAMLERINAWQMAFGGAPVTLKQVIIHLMHRMGAIFVVCAVVFVSCQAWIRQRSDKRTLMTVTLIDIIVGLQFFLGALTVWTGRSPYVASAHVVTGAALLGLCVLLVLRSSPLQWRDGRSCAR